MDCLTLIYVHFFGKANPCCIYDRATSYRIGKETTTSINMVKSDLNEFIDIMVADSIR